MVVKDSETQVLYEVVLSIGTSLNLKEMLRKSLSILLKKLNCTAAGVFRCEHEGIEQVYSIPKNTGEAASSAAFDLMHGADCRDFVKRLPLMAESDSGGYSHVMELADFGFIVLEKKDSPLELSTVRSLSPVLSKLAGACNACLRNEDLERSHKRLLEMNRELAEKTADLEISRDALLGMMSEMKKAEEELCKLGRAVNQSPSMVVITDTTGLIEYVNPRFTLVTGYNPEDVIGRSLAEIDGLSPEEFSSLIKAVSEGGEFQGEFRRKRGEKFLWESAIISPIKDSSGARTHFIKLAEDITERKRMEEELIKADKLESIGILAGGIAHDFNNILTSLLINISLAKMSAAPDVYRRLKAAERATFRAQHMTRQLLTFSKGGAPVKKVASIRGLIRESADFALRGSSLKCEYSIQRGLWPVEVDEGQINQVISNLIINAEQAMAAARDVTEQRQAGVIKVTAKNIAVKEGEVPKLAAGRYVLLSIEDTGTGIEEEHLSKIFDPYFTTKDRGTGLGLATTWSIVKGHGGHIGVVSEQGAGASFHIYLPASDKEPPAETISERGILRGRGNVLVMDDESDIRDSVSEALSYFGYEVDFAEDGAEAVKLYKKTFDSGKGYDAVVMDLTIPGGMGGKETIKSLIEIDPDVRAIVSSGYSNDPVLSDFARYGFSGIITKPYRIEELSALLQKVINRPS